MDTFDKSSNKKSINVTVKLSNMYIKMNIETNSTVKKFVNDCCESYKMKYWAHSNRCPKCSITQKKNTKNILKKTYFIQNIKDQIDEYYYPN
jgi:hypothetical protein